MKLDKEPIKFGKYVPVDPDSWKHLHVQMHASSTGTWSCCPAANYHNHRTSGK